MNVLESHGDGRLIEAHSLPLRISAPVVVLSSLCLDVIRRCVDLETVLQYIQHNHEGDHRG